MGSRKRATSQDIIEDIMEALPVRRDTTVQAIARDSGLAWETVDRWLRLMVRIQELPRILPSKSPLGRGEVYRRDRAPYPKRRAEAA
ncbi:hypothetical protein ISS40_07920 [Candidatus Bathyarchaeota archaeon]|nr:hypothetical protein [Candidatus Bathyarchaeota archaeon]